MVKVARKVTLSVFFYHPMAVLNSFSLFFRVFDAIFVFVSSPVRDIMIQSCLSSTFSSEYDSISPV